VWTELFIETCKNCASTIRKYIRVPGGTRINTQTNIVGQLLMPHEKSILNLYIFQKIFFVKKKYISLISLVSQYFIRLKVYIYI
jgi:hypothetical protein